MLLRWRNTDRHRVWMSVTSNKRWRHQKNGYWIGYAGLNKYFFENFLEFYSRDNNFSTLHKYSRTLQRSYESQLYEAVRKQREYLIMRFKKLTVCICSVNSQKMAGPSLSCQACGCVDNQVGVFRICEMPTNSFVGKLNFYEGFNQIVSSLYTLSSHLKIRESSRCLKRLAAAPATSGWYLRRPEKSIALTERVNLLAKTTGSNSNFPLTFMTVLSPSSRSGTGRHVCSRFSHAHKLDFWSFSLVATGEVNWK